MTEFTHAFTAREADLLRDALQTVATHLVPQSSSEYDEDAGVWVTSQESNELQVHLRALAIYTARALASILGARKDSEAIGMQWVVDPGAPGGLLRGGAGGTLSGDERSGPVFAQIAGLAWQIVVCRAGRPTIEDEARRNSADAPELMEGIVESERGKIDLLAPVLRRLMQSM